MRSEVDKDRLDVLVQAAERVLRERTSIELRLKDPQLVRERARSLLLRCAVTGWDGVGSVIVKRNTGDDERGFTDWAGLVFLSELEGASGVAPEIYAGDRLERLLVMEDLGGSRSLEDVLSGRDGATDEADVVALLRAMAVQMATLVAATLGKEHLFREIRASLPGSKGLGRASEVERWLEGRHRLTRWCELLNLVPPAGFDASMADVAHALAEPGENLSFSHGDPAPSNNHIAGERVRLVDFEYAGYRHFLYDITAWHVLCPLPERWVREMQAAFREALFETTAHTLVADLRRHELEWARVCAYRALAMLTWFPENLLESEHEWTPGWSARQAMISTALRLQQATAGERSLAPLTELGDSVAYTLQERWPELGGGELRWPGVVSVS